MYVHVRVCVWGGGPKIKTQVIATRNVPNASASQAIQDNFQLFSKTIQVANTSNIRTLTYVNLDPKSRNMNFICANPVRGSVNLVCRQLIVVTAQTTRVTYVQVGAGSNYPISFLLFVVVPQGTDNISGMKILRSSFHF